MKLKPSIKARALTAISLLAVVFSFQNCGKAPISQLDPTLQYTKMEASQFSTLSTGDERTNVSIKVDLNSGTIQKSSFYGNAGVEHKCLSQVDRSRLDAILIDAEVCKPVQAKAGAICTMEYVYPYAQLSEADLSVSLGAKADNCAGKIDLCGNKSEELQAFVAELNARVDSMNCN